MRDNNAREQDVQGQFTKPIEGVLALKFVDKWMDAANPTTHDEIQSLSGSASIVDGVLSTWGNKCTVQKTAHFHTFPNSEEAQLNRRKWCKDIQRITNFDDSQKCPRAYLLAYASTEHLRQKIARAIY